ncbi:MAG: hypothetical protein A2W33_02245 [Chloroflexi bacterium RBG_16_52_11]|nr:MAG: hypothetical protein A2W33_02245 [Chloroflexi bacterium RBG_16_52_11]
MSETTLNQTKSLTSGKLATSGAIAGLAGGLVFGMLMGMMGVLPMVGMLIRVENAIVGFVVHMVISAFIGAVYGLVAGRFGLTWTNALLGGIVNGVVWWLLGALTLMPLFLGMTQMVFVIGTDQWLSLMGHILYGLVTAFVFVALAKRN